MDYGSRAVRLFTVDPELCVDSCSRFVCLCTVAPGFCSLVHLAQKPQQRNITYRTSMHILTDAHTLTAAHTLTDAHTPPIQAPLGKWENRRNLPAARSVPCHRPPCLALPLFTCCTLVMVPSTSSFAVMFVPLQPSFPPLSLVALSAQARRSSAVFPLCLLLPPPAASLSAVFVCRRVRGSCIARFQCACSRLLVCIVSANLRCYHVRVSHRLLTLVFVVASSFECRTYKIRRLSVAIMVLPDHCGGRGGRGPRGGRGGRARVAGACPFVVHASSFQGDLFTPGQGLDPGRRQGGAGRRQGIQGRRSAGTNSSSTFTSRSASEQF